MEVGSEFILHLSSIMLMQFLNLGYSPEQLQYLEYGALSSIGALLLLNVCFILQFLIADCKAKKRKKAWEARKKKYEEVMDERAKKKELA